MRYIYTHHVRTRMRQRRVSESQIAEALANYDMTYSSSDDSTCIVGTTAEGRKLKVVVVGAYLQQQDRITIKTVAWKDEG